MLTILRNVICRWGLIVPVLLSALPLRAAYGTVEVALYAPSEGAKSGVISREGLVRLNLVTGGVRGSATLTLKEFADADGNTAAVSFQGGSQPEQIRTITLDGERFPITLAVEGARPGIDYFGELWIKIGDSPLQSFTFKLTHPLPVNYSSVPPDATKLPVPVSDTGIARFYLDVRDLKAHIDKARLVVSAFTGMEDGRVASVYLAGDAGKKTDKEDKEASGRQARTKEGPEVQLVKDFLLVTLDASDLTVGQKYLGDVTVEGKDERLVAYLELTRHAMARNADPALDQASIAVEAVTFKLWGRCSLPAVFVLLSETSGDKPLVGVYASGASAPDQPTGAKLLPPASLDVRFCDDGNVSPSLLTADPSDLSSLEKCTLPKGGQRLVRIQVKEGLLVGLYKTKLKFGALNADLSKLDDLSITIRVKRHWIWAAIFLAIGVGLSWLLTKGVETLSQRAELSKRIYKHRQNYWLRLDNSGRKPIVRARAKIAKMREAMSKETGIKKLSVPRIVSEEISQIEAHLPYLERLSACMAYWDDKDSIEARRARKAIRVLVNMIQSVPLEAKPGPGIEKALMEMEQWQDGKLLMERYLQHLKGDIDDLLLRIDVKELGNKKTKPVQETFEAVTVCVPDPERLIKVIEKLKAIPDAPDLSEITAAFNSLSAVYKSLRDGITAARADVEKMTSQDGQSPLATAVEVLRKKFMDAGTAEMQPLALLFERLPLVIKSLQGDPLKTVGDIYGSLEQLAGIDSNQLKTAWDRFDSAESELLSSVPDVVAWLKARVEQGKNACDLREGIALEELYMALKVIWESRNDPELTKELIDAYRARPDPEELFKISDNRVWRNLENNLVVVEPSGIRESEAKKGERLESMYEEYQPITFRVAPTNDALGDNYLFKYGLSFHWKISIPGESFHLEPITREPTVTQFIPYPFKTVRVAVEVQYKRTTCPLEVPAHLFGTTESGEFRWRNAFSGVEMLGVGLALVVAVATGLNSEYLKADLLGAPGDYLGLIVWGIASDQVKNILQKIGTGKNNES